MLTFRSHAWLASEVARARPDVAFCNFFIPPARERRANSKLRIAFITWGDHIHLEIVLERRAGEPYLTCRKMILLGLLDQSAVALDLRRDQ